MTADNPDARAGRDVELICSIYDLHAGALVRALQRMGASSDVAWDATQETFARLLLRGPRGFVQPESAWPWLLVTARNVLIDWQRRTSVDRNARQKLGIETVECTEDELENALRRIDARRERSAIVEAFEALPSTQRHALIGRVLRENDYEALACMLATSEENVRVRVSRGLRQLRASLEGAR